MKTRLSQLLWGLVWLLSLTSSAQTTSRESELDAVITAMENNQSVKDRKVNLRNLQFETGTDRLTSGDQRYLDSLALALVLLLDLNLPLVRQGTPKLAGFDVLEYLGKHKPGVLAIVLSQHSDYSFIKRALHLNARGYMLKNTSSAELFEAIRVVGEGKRYLPPKVELQLQLRENPSADDPTIAFAKLSKREVEVVRLVAQGFTSQEIATHLKLKRDTVEEYRENVTSKLGAKNAPDMVRIVYENRLL